MHSDAPSRDALPLILIVEDEEPIAQALVIVIEEMGYQAIHAPNGKSALAIVQKRRPAVILTDLMMPIMNGTTFIARLRELLGAETPPIVLMSAAGHTFLEASGADTIIAKPFDIAEVEEIIKRLVDRQP